MQILMFPLKIISIPLIIIIGESHLNEKNKMIALLILAFLYNNLLGFATRFSTFLLSALPSVFMIITIGFSLLVYLIAINIYVKRKIEINMIIYVMLNVVAFFVGLLLI